MTLLQKARMNRTAAVAILRTRREQTLVFRSRRSAANVVALALAANTNRAPVIVGARVTA